jgi:uncharacterized protein YneF (UPF0154 family)
MENAGLAIFCIIQFLPFVSGIIMGFWIARRTDKGWIPEKLKARIQQWME